MFPKGTFEVIDLVPFEKCRKIILLQFGGVDDKLYPNHSKIIDIFHLETPADEEEDSDKFEEQKHLDQLVAQIKLQSKFKNNLLMIDAYFALRMALEYYIQEKKVWLNKLRLVFASFSKTGIQSSTNTSDSKTGSWKAELQLTSYLDFQEFREFMREAFKDKKVANQTPKFTNKEILKVFRLAWSFGNGKVDFQSFLSAFRETNLMLKLLTMQNSACYGLCHEATRVDEHSYYLQTKDLFKQKLSLLQNKIFLVNDNFKLFGIPRLNYSMSNLVQLMDGNLRFKPEDEFLLQGDRINLIIEIWQDLMNSLKTYRTTVLQSSKISLKNSKEKSKRIFQLFLKHFLSFTNDVDPIMFNPYKQPSWISDRFSNMQRMMKMTVLERALEAFRLAGIRKRAKMKELGIKGDVINTVMDPNSPQKKAARNRSRSPTKSPQKRRVKKFNFKRSGSKSNVLKKKLSNGKNQVDGKKVVEELSNRELKSPIKKKRPKI